MILFLCGGGFGGGEVREGFCGLGYGGGSQGRHGDWWVGGWVVMKVVIGV